MTQNQWLIKSAINRIALRAQGPALPLAKQMLELIPQFLSAGMSAEMSLRESLLLVIQLARSKARHCVGIERYGLDDFIESCMEMEANLEQFVSMLLT